MPPPEAESCLAVREMSTWGVKADPARKLSSSTGAVSRAAN